MSAADRDEKTRADLQDRLAVLFKVMFWSLVALVVFVWGQYASYEPKIPESRRNIVYAGAAVGLGAMAVIWRALLVGRTLSLRALHRLDFVYSTGIGVAFGASAYLQKDLRASGYMALVYTTFTVFARALLVPSSARRTFTTSLLTFVPMSVSALAVSLTTEQELTPTAFFCGYQLLSLVAVVLATAGSSVIYGLRSQVSVAAQLGQYKLERVISKGGMGTVYRAHHTLLRRETAIKLVQVANTETLEHFEQEVQAMSELTHPNTVVVYDYGRSLDGQFYYAMEYLPGVDLHNFVRRYHALPSGRVARLLAQVCGALQEAHERKLIHRDIKPANIIVCERGGVPDVAKVVDFGLVKDVGKTTSTTQTIKGTVGFIAPEVVTDPDLVGPAVDIYAVGCVAYYLVTGRNVFTATTPMEQLRLHVKAEPTPPSQLVPAIAPELERIILRCLAKQPSDRFASARELAVALRAVPTGDWTDAMARAWWRDRREVEAHEASLSANPTRTITVDIGRRT
ncbi:MAG: serine/threonine-protein kinase [Kofleriaceae bacterium]